MSDSIQSRSLPELPFIARKPLALVPISLVATLITSAINAIFKTPLEAGELSFLERRVLNVCVTDAELGFSLRLERNRLQAAREVEDADLVIEGTIYTFLLLATRREDADTLFFGRQLKTSGDTELGLHVKNFLDGLELETLPYHRTTDTIIRRSLVIAETVDKFRSRLPNWLSRIG
jgi:predicted lipid carrier protein YhbT